MRQLRRRRVTSECCAAQEMIMWAESNAALSA